MTTPPPYDAILIPGGGLNDDGTLPAWVKARFDRAITVSTGQPIIALSAGTVHKPPPRNADGFPIYESTVGADYLIANGVNPSQILTETCSYDTIGNAYFARVIHTDPLQVRNLLVITSAFHMPRTRAVFEWVLRLDDDDITLKFDAVNDTGIDDAALRARKEREQASLNALQDTIAQIQTLKALHQWLHTQHAAYATSLTPRRVQGDARKTY